MQPQQINPLEQFFHQAVRNSYEGKLGLNDPDVTGYVAHLLTEFSHSDKLYKFRDEMGHPIDELQSLIDASDPVNGSAPSFDAERMVRKHIGDYALFVAGMYPEAVEPWRAAVATILHCRNSFTLARKATTSSASSIYMNTSRKRRFSAASPTGSSAASLA